MQVIKVILQMLLGAMLLSCANNDQNEIVTTQNDILGRPTFSRDGKRILFSYGDSKEASIWSAATDGTSCTTLIQMKDRLCIDPLCTHDGLRVVFSSKKAYEPCNVYQYDLRTSTVSQLYKSHFNDQAEALFHDDDRIAIVRSRTYRNYSPSARAHLHDQDIVIYSIKNKSLLPVTDGKFYEVSSLSISPDQSRILCRLYDDDDATRLWLVPLSGVRRTIPLQPNMTRFMQPKDRSWKYSYLDFYYPQLSPDGKAVLFEWIYNQLYMMNLSTKEVVQLTNMNSMIVEPSFSFDGQRIVFVAVVNDGVDEIDTMDADGSHLERLPLTLDADPTSRGN